ncbi:MFS transporter [Paractinoplanes maris]|uniref:MFS transporter n=1 Tax=Paractinoplanes maris TaxID=1734446 RepID=UPI002020CEC3|nr:MFS transporter [Actinoplanes maris]
MTETSTARWADSLKVLQHFPYRQLFLARTASMLGSAMAPIALAFGVLAVTDDVSAVAIVVAARQIPNVAFTLIGGAIADRWRRDRILLWANLISGVAQIMTAALLFGGTATVALLAALAVVNGTASAFSGPATSGLIRATAPVALLQQANALLSLSRNAATIGGAALGGVLVGFAGPAWGFLVDGATFLVSAWLMTRLDLRQAARMRASSLLGDLRDGWHEFVGRRWLWTVVLMCTVVNFAEAATITVLAPIALKDDGGAGLLGLILTAQAAGFVVGAAAGLRFQPDRPLLVGVAAVLLVAPLMLVLAVTTSPVPLLLSAFVNGLGYEIFGVFWAVCLQGHVPDASMSRIGSIDAFASYAIMPLGALLAIPAAQVLGYDGAFLAGGLLILLTAVMTLLVRDVRVLPRPQEAEA